MAQLQHRPTSTQADLHKGPAAIRRLYNRAAVAARYEADRLGSLQGKLMHLREIEIANGHLVVDGSKRLLEIAVGTGRVTRELEGFEGAVGVDASRAMLAELRVHDPRWRFLLADALCLGFKANAFDAVVSFRLIRHFERADRERSCSEVVRVLRPGGLFIVDSLNADRGLLGALADRATWGLARLRGFRTRVHDALLTRVQLVEEITAAGLELEAIVAVNTRYALTWLYTLIGHLPGTRAWARAALQRALEWDRERADAAKPFAWVVVARKPCSSPS